MNRNRLARVIMVQGTSSHAGKSLLVTALCRIFRQDGFRTAPFKAQNMSLNSCPTPDGLEIGRSQATQAAAAGIPARVEMNPVLLKPETEGRTQVVVMGRPVSVTATDSHQPRGPQLWDVVVRALDRLRREFDIVVIEGAGSPVELNIKERDIANMRVARHADAPVLLVGDIDLGGVFAQMVGTLALLEPAEHRLVKGLVVNKFRGDLAQFETGVDLLEAHTGVPVAGVLPFLSDVRLPEEDGVGLPSASLGDSRSVLDVAVMRVPHIANFDDFDPLGREPGVRVRFVGSAAEFGEPDLLILPGSKTTVADLDWLRVQGLAERIRTARSSGTAVIGICAGFQMLGTRLLDPDGVESRIREAEGLGLVSTTTTFLPEKKTHQVTAVVETGRGLLAGCSACGSPVTRATRATPPETWKRAPSPSVPGRAARYTCWKAGWMKTVSRWVPICTGCSTTMICAAGCWKTLRVARASRCRTDCASSIPTTNTTGWRCMCAATSTWTLCTG